jgi:CxxC motif-containing protein (DUF1111 family)
MAVLTCVPVGLRVLSWPQAGSLNLDPEMVQAGEVLFNHEWQPNDPLCPNGDGLGPVYNATSCVACHQQGGVGGSGGTDHNVVTFVFVPEKPGQPVREGVLHNFATSVNHEETLANLDVTFSPSSALDLMKRPGAFVTGRGGPDLRLSQRKTPALFGAGLIDSIPYRAILAHERKQRLRQNSGVSDEDAFPVGRALHLQDGRVGKFGWKAQTTSLADFVQAACANELGLGNPGTAQPASLNQPTYQPVGLDLTLQQCNQITAFVASLPRPIEQVADDPILRDRATQGKRLFSKVGCADCHTPQLGSVEGLYSDLLLHKMGSDLAAAGSTYYGMPRQMLNLASGDGPQQDEWRTPPLWGVADSAPYLHDGRAKTLEDAIRLHGGQATRSKRQFQNLHPEEQGSLLIFLGTLRAPQ